MDFSTLIVIVIVLGVISAIGSVLWWVAIIWLGVTAWRKIAKQLDAQAIDIDRLIAQAAAASGPGRTDLQGVISSRMLHFQQQMRSLDDLHRQRYELKAAEMQSYAASNGLFIDLPRY